MFYCAKCYPNNPYFSIGQKPFEERVILKGQARNKVKETFME
jgi:hypothetical protein